jgi:hypothetical protein
MELYTYTLYGFLHVGHSVNLSLHALHTRCPHNGTAVSSLVKVQ